MDGDGFFFRVAAAAEDQIAFPGHRATGGFGNASGSPDFGAIVWVVGGHLVIACQYQEFLTSRFGNDRGGVAGISGSWLSPDFAASGAVEGGEITVVILGGDNHI